MPVYADATSPEKFWLLMVISLKKSSLTVKYFSFQEHNESVNTYTLDKVVYSVSVNSIVRYESLSKEYVVLQKFHPFVDNYFVCHKVVKLIEDEVDSLTS